ncbi:MAG: SDR family NAD(P)-dependent oxidoreductase, partial [Pirellulaceae bacterium]|nr:SDR family NAD(P)-dependent oxidoreductase [Pirellulaceae bacterium]
STLQATPAWRNRVDLRSQQYLSDHVVRNTCMFPAAGVIEIAAHAARQIQDSASIVLQNLQLISPCLLTDDRPQQFETAYRSDRRQLTIACREIGEPTWQTIASVSISDDVTKSPNITRQIDVARTTCTESVNATALYDYCARLGLDYGDQFRGVVRGVRRNGEAVVDVQLPVSVSTEISDYGIHPAMLDACFHGMIAADPVFDHTLGGLYLPTEIKEIRVLQRATAKVTAHIRLISKDRYRMLADIDIINDDGEACLLLRGFESQRVRSQLIEDSVHDLVYQYRWIQSDVATDAEGSDPITPAVPGRTWCLFADHSGLANELAGRLRQNDMTVVTVTPGESFAVIDEHSVQVDPENRDDFVRLFRQFEFTDLVYLWGLNVPDNEDLTSQQLADSTRLTTVAPMHLVQAWETGQRPSDAKLTIVTVDAQSINDSPASVSVAQGPLVGFGRVIVSECAALRTKLVDVSGQQSPDRVDSLLAELISQNDDEDEVMYREGQRWLQRFVPQADQFVTDPTASPSALSLDRSAGIDELHYRTRATQGPSECEIEIEVLAAGLNFSDVMKALNLYPGLPDGPVVLGAECSGRVTRVGAGVSDFKVGDEVMAVAPGSFATHVIVTSDLVAPKPLGISHAEAATIPIAFLTAHHALVQCGHIGTGDSVLIHSASGGVGLAAIQLARLAGATIFATAGNDQKRNHVRNLGAAKVMDSRSLQFADQILDATDGQGVDLVLNSLPGEAIAKGLSIIKPGGRFLEIGKRDIYNDAPLGLHPFRNNLALFAIDLDQLFKQQPRSIGQCLRDLVPRFESGELQPLGVKTYAADKTADAFRWMQKGKHIGKIAVSYQQPPREVRPGTYAPIQFRHDGSYWIAGGLGGFGLQIARWLVDHGAGSVVLSGRSKTVALEARAAIQEMQASGAKITVLPADITQADDVRQVLDAIQADLPPLRGVFHTAMVLEDRLLVDLDRETLQRVLRPKVLGGWNLHQQTVDLPLDHFVLFSSLSSIFGHAGQANYSAANAALDSLGHYRRSLGLPACVMNWGHLGEVGYLAQRSELGERLERQGVLSFSVQQATDALEYALQTQSVQMSVLRMDWSTWRGLGLTTRVSPRFAHLIHGAGDAADVRGAHVTADDLRAADQFKRIEMIGEMLRAKAGKLLGIEMQQLDTKRPLLDLGLDSLMAVEMRNWVESQVEINLPISSLMRSSGLDSLTQTVAEALQDQQSVGIAPTSDDHAITSHRAETLLDELPELSDNEVSELLSQMLRQQQDGSSDD